MDKDQHGTAIIVGAANIAYNLLKMTAVGVKTHVGARFIAP